MWEKSLSVWVLLATRSVLFASTAKSGRGFWLLLKSIFLPQRFKSCLLLCIFLGLCGDCCVGVDIERLQQIKVQAVECLLLLCLRLCVFRRRDLVFFGDLEVLDRFLSRGTTLRNFEFQRQSSGRFDLRWRSLHRLYHFHFLGRVSRRLPLQSRQTSFPLWGVWPFGAGQFWDLDCVLRFQYVILRTRVNSYLVLTLSF